MRILIESNHRYPFYGAVGSGRHPREFPSGSGWHMQDLLARGLAELGHEVLYLLREGCDAPLPDGVRLVSGPVADIDIFQTTGSPSADLDVHEFVARHGVPWVLTCHLDRSGGALPAANNWIFVSRSLARTYGKERHVYNGIDPADCLFSRAKEDFLLFMAAAERAIPKGLFTAFAVSKRTGVRLVVAGTGRSYDAIEHISGLCRDAGAEYVGDIRGAAKAAWLAAAKGVILPTETNEGCPLTLIEALMSGTPVIASTAGGIPEMVTPDTGFLCDDEDDYVRAVARLREIASDRCRQHALERFHYLRMARDYVVEFEAEIARHRDGQRRRPPGI
jgi:glycosyltransferase involved in cell wall biosynthesis